MTISNDVLNIHALYPVLTVTIVACYELSPVTNFRPTENSVGLNCFGVCSVGLVDLQ